IVERSSAVSIGLPLVSAVSLVSMLSTLLSIFLIGRPEYTATAAEQRGVRPYTEDMYQEPDFI
ncbi:MAG: hypothetical protein WBB25_06270, partial [Sulfitobacter sp.]